ncbi:type VI secretion system protein ImpK [Kribbella pratensis]|uniref:Type VI secretion system protein ImpK n=1 Tax=Kribbella pratensis TaxID=2512112 RepID=A0ABY2FR99_9ACTN|nr:hypothetical protein [Kribbella pratensis]TDW95468.1 type VI secretion system protein ImpK [Kribbella pratensis]
MTAFRQQVALGRAAELARQGDLSGAATLLTDLEDPSVEVLDLLARIRAQQRRWDEADALWAEVVKTAGGTGTAAGAVAGRRMVAAIRGHRRAARPVLPVVVAVVLVGAVVGGGAVALGGRADEPVAQPAQVQPTVTPSVDTGAEERAAELARRLAALEAQRRAEAAATAAKLVVIARRVAGAGVLVQREKSAVRVVFTEGVFEAGTDLSTSGERALDVLGKRLPGLKARITVTGYSVVVPGGTNSGGSRTALLRARVATQQLSTASGLPLTAFTMQSGDQAHPPYRTDARNRTVTVTLTPGATP